MSLALCAAWGCSRPQPARTAGVVFLQARADTGLEMRVLLPRDTIHAVDLAPVELIISLVNGPRPTYFDNDPERFDFELLDAAGKMVPPNEFISPSAGLNGDHRMLLHANSVLSKVQNLRCLDYDAYAFVPAQEHECRGSWNLRKAGTYRVVVKYYGPRVWHTVQTPPGYSGPREPVGNDSLAVALDSATNQPVTRPLVDGRQLADTVTLVVVAP